MHDPRNNFFLLCYSSPWEFSSQGWNKEEYMDLAQYLDHVDQKQQLWNQFACR